MALLRAFVSEPVLLAFCIIGVVLVTFITLVRIYVRVSRQQHLHSDDFTLFLGVALYYALAGLYIADIPYLYTFLGYTSGHASFTSEIPEAYTHMMMINFAVTPLFWAVLWAVKLSLLLFFRRVVQNTPLMKAWCVVLAVTILTFIGCLVSQFTSCNSIADFTVLGNCVAPNEQRAQIISLYYSFAADVVTDLAIMAIPLRVLIGLRISRRDKISLGLLFSVQTIAILFSMIRVFLVWAKTGSTTPSPAWLGLWAVIEGMVSIVVGCIPAISQVFRSAREGSGHGRTKRTNSAPSHEDSLPTHESERAVPIVVQIQAMRHEHDCREKQSSV